MPYTQEYFTALGTAIARKFFAIGRVPFKVAALDLDNTLWKEVAGEDGASGIVVNSTRLDLQQFMSAQRESGMLLALCSKNNEEDAREIFQSHPEMPLRWMHLRQRVSTGIRNHPISAHLRRSFRWGSTALYSSMMTAENARRCKRTVLKF